MGPQEDDGGGDLMESICSVELPTRDDDDGEEDWVLVSAPEPPYARGGETSSPPRGMRGWGMRMLGLGREQQQEQQTGEGTGGASGYCEGNVGTGMNGAAAQAHAQPQPQSSDLIRGGRGLWVWLDDWGYDVPYEDREQWQLENAWASGMASVVVRRGRETYIVRFAEHTGQCTQENRRTGKRRRVRRIRGFPNRPTGVVAAASNARDTMSLTVRSVREMDMETASTLLIEATCNAGRTLVTRMMPTREQAAEAALIATRRAVTVLYATCKFIALRMRRARRGPLRHELDPGSDAYQCAAKAFRRTLPHMTIIKIEEVRNQPQRAYYLAHKRRMDLEEQPSIPRPHGGNEQVLFHGTDDATADRICARMFDRSHCGKSGTMLGKGSYFARDASFAYRWCCRNSKNEYTTIIATVLVGNACAGGHPEVKEPPAMTHDHDGKPLRIPATYDTVVDDVKNPRLYVVFEEYRAVPLFIVTFKEGGPITRRPLLELK